MHVTHDMTNQFGAPTQNANLFLSFSSFCYDVHVDRARQMKYLSNMFVDCYFAEISFRPAHSRHVRNPFQQNKMI